jgi:hypothetical protein
MKASSLHDIWESPDNTRLTPKQFSFRLPIHIAAKVAALCEMYPQKSRTQIIADLLTSALDEFEQNLPMALGDPITDEEEDIERKIADHERRKYEPIFNMAVCGPNSAGLQTNISESWKRSLATRTLRRSFKRCISPKQI